MQTVYKETPISELPPVANENYVTVSDKGIMTSRFFNGKRFETAHYEGEITHWLKPIDITSIIEEQGKKDTIETKNAIAELVNTHDYENLIEILGSELGNRLYNIVTLLRKTI